MKRLSSIMLSLVLLFAVASPALAHCPLCTAGAGAGLALSRWLGVDDSITGIWMSAFLGATALWSANSLKTSGPKGIWPGGKNIPYLENIVYWLILGTTIWSFYAFNFISEHNGLIMGIPKLIFGMLSGAVVFYLVDILNHYIRRKRGKVLFPYQPIAFSLGAMMSISVADFIFINYYI